MNPILTNLEIEHLARQRAKRKTRWHIHALVFVLVNAGLALMSTYTGRHFAVITALGWGLGLLIHGAAVFLLPAGGGLRNRLVSRERERLLRQQNQL